MQTEQKYSPHAEPVASSTEKAAHVSENGKLATDFNVAEMLVPAVSDASPHLIQSETASPSSTRTKSRLAIKFGNQ